MSNPVFPFREPIAGTEPVTQPWRIWFRDLFVATTQTASQRIAAVALTGQIAALAVTPFATGSLSAGLYRVTVFTHILTPASINSSLIVTVSFTHNAVACSLATADLNTNLTTSVQGTTFPIQIDAGTPISYSVAYVSNAAGMTYALSAAVETVHA